MLRSESEKLAVGRAVSTSRSLAEQIRRNEMEILDCRRVVASEGEGEGEGGGERGE